MRISLTEPLKLDFIGTICIRFAAAMARTDALNLVQLGTGGDARRSMMQDRRMEDRISISLLTELLDRVDRMARHAGRSRADIITSALHRGLRDDERVQSFIDAFDEIDT
jgi:predicted DNA-binding protein